MIGTERESSSTSPKVASVASNESVGSGITGPAGAAAPLPGAAAAPGAPGAAGVAGADAGCFRAGRSTAPGTCGLRDGEGWLTG